MAKRYGNPLRYQLLRSHTRKLAARRALLDPLLARSAIDPTQLRFEAITPAAVEASYEWGTYPWEQVPRWKETDTKGFDLALWYGDDLWGLCYATPRKSVITLKIILLEGKPGRAPNHKGIIAPLALGAVLDYGVLLGCEQMEIQSPAVGAVQTYLKLGFYFDRCQRLVRPLATP
ncbi:N-acetyltransferase [Pseudomonas sp. NPDC007930]|uniref:N-acetyltransferase n=1 Tax=Pseudomonas sp. NPDC007930 TaxID=3364417 RepID=UPI0036EFF009